MPALHGNHADLGAMLARSFTNAPFDAPVGPRIRDWQIVPPGHFVAGKGARLQQFALTPEQLYQREVRRSPCLQFAPAHHWLACLLSSACGQAEGCVEGKLAHSISVLLCCSSVLFLTIERCINSQL